MTFTTQNCTVKFINQVKVFVIVFFNMKCLVFNLLLASFVYQNEKGFEDLYFKFKLVQFHKIYDFLFQKGSQYELNEARLNRIMLNYLKLRTLAMKNGTFCNEICE